MLMAWKMEERAIHQGKPLASRIWKRLVNKILP